VVFLTYLTVLPVYFHTILVYALPILLDAPVEGLSQYLCVCVCCFALLFCLLPPHRLAHAFASLGGEIVLKFFGGDLREGIVQFEVYVRLV